MNEHNMDSGFFNKEGFTGTEPENLFYVNLKTFRFSKEIRM